MDFGNMAHGPNAIYFVQVEPDSLFIEIMYGTTDGIPMDPKHIRVPTDIVWDYDAQQLEARRNESGDVVIMRKQD